MTREEAIRCLCVHSSTNGSGLCTDEQHQEAKQMAIKALEQEPCEDAISRETVLDMCKKEIDHISKNWQNYHSPSEAKSGFVYIATNISDLPPVTPQSEIIRCSQCKYAEVADSEDTQDGYTCQFHRGSIWFSGSYCSWAEREDKE